MNLSSGQRLRSLVYGSANKSEEKELKVEKKIGKTATLGVGLESGLQYRAGPPRDLVWEKFFFWTMAEALSIAP